MRCFVVPPWSVSLFLLDQGREYLSVLLKERGVGEPLEDRYGVLRRNCREGDSEKRRRTPSRRRVETSGTLQREEYLVSSRD